MPEFLRALLAVLFLATAVFVFTRKSVCAAAMAAEDFQQRRNLWYLITAVLFLSNNFWIFILLTAALLLLNVPSEKNRVALFFFLLFAVPTTEAQLSGLGVINHFFAISYPRLLSLTVLLPAFLLLRKRPDTDSFGTLLPDKFLVGYLVLLFGLTFAASTTTHALRAGVFYPFLDIFLPYYVASRSLRNLKGFRDALMGFVVAALILSAIGAFEFSKHWLLYSNLNTTLGVDSGYGNYLERGDGTLRAQASTGHAIPLGYVIAVAMGLFSFLWKLIPDASNRLVWLTALIAGVLSPVSRGPWVGVAVILLVFAATSPLPGKFFMRLTGLGLLGLPALFMSSAGEKFIDLLPFVGSTAAETVDYRNQLITVSMAVIAQNPFFGAFNFMLNPEMEQMRQGQGIIDIVNTYLSVTLGSGLVGLSLFAGFFLSVAMGIFVAMIRVSDRHDEQYLLGRALLSTQVGIMVIIFTVASITVVPIVYWSVAGLGVAYARMLARARASIGIPKPAVSAKRPHGAVAPRA